VRSGGDFGCDLVEMELHGFAVAGRQHEGGAGSAFGASVGCAKNRDLMRGRSLRAAEYP
jgi:hypothetical protein